MSAGEEVELKLQVGLADLAVLLAHPIFADRNPVSRDQTSLYFDTDKRVLRKAGLSLRIRSAGGQRTQTIKTESKAAASLFARGEWERPVEADTPDLADVPPTMADALEGTDSLAPIFTVAVNRTTVLHADGPDRIELVADQGRVSAGEHESAIAEIELELLDGDRGALFDLARRIAAVVPVRLGVRTKSERGYALLDGPKTSAKAEPIVLSPDDDAATLFEAVAGACIRQFRLNEDRVLADGDPAALHQARVALRRLRSALSMFKTMLAGPDLDRFQVEFRALAGALGTVRDVDVMIAKIEDVAVLETLRAARVQRYEAVVALLESSDTRMLLLDFVAWLSVGAWREGADTRELRETLAPVAAAQMLDRLRRRVKRRGKRLARLDEEARHRVRIAGKKLRYAAEFFADLYRDKKACRRHAAFLEAIGDLQTALGHLNDLVSGHALLEELGFADAEAILAAGRKSDRKKQLDRAERAYDDLIAEKRFWR